MKLLLSVSLLILVFMGQATQVLTKLISILFTSKQDFVLHAGTPDILPSLAVRGGTSDVNAEDILVEIDIEYDSEEVDSIDPEESYESSCGEEEEDLDWKAKVQEGSLRKSIPVKIILKTALTSNALIDQYVEITASPSRTVKSLKQSVSRKFKSRPPIDTIILRLDGLVLNDDVLVQDILKEVEDDEFEEEDQDDTGYGLPKITIFVDMIPPVDPKFGTEMKSRLDELTSNELLNSYVANLASIYQNSIDLMHANENDFESEQNSDNDEMDDYKAFTATRSPISLVMQRNSAVLKEKVKDSLSEKELELLDKAGPLSPPESNSFKKLKGTKRIGGATVNVRRALQKNLNINWPNTVRNFLLFLFFGYFGGCNTTSRTIMLFSAPACFIIQARPIKIAIKQLFYTIGNPPGILLSLLPAPQQAIMSCDDVTSLQSIYGKEVQEV